MAEAPLGHYVYCIVPAAEPPPVEGVSGVDPPFGVEIVTQADLSALISRVRLEHFGDEALRRNLEDLEWVERTARVHDAVLARALTVDAVLPLRLCTIFADEAHVREMLERRHDSLAEALQRVRGHAEWSVKVMADPSGLEAAVRERGPAPAAAAAGAERAGPAAGEAPGRAFFTRKKQEQALREEARAGALEAAQDVHGRLRREAAAATFLPPQDPELSRRPGRMILNGAYLVHRSRARAFATAAAELRERHRGSGLDLDVSGPWAPYNFVGPTSETDE
jgi:hypothetical protein